MSKQWKCGDCCYFGTDACHFPSMREEYVACEHLVADHDYAYQQGGADAVDAFVNECRANVTSGVFCPKAPNNLYVSTDMEAVWMDDIEDIAKQIKEEQKNE